MRKPISYLALLFAYFFTLNLGLAQSQIFQYDWVLASPYPQAGNPFLGTDAFAVSATGDQFTALTSEGFIDTGAGNMGSIDLTRYDSEGNLIWSINLNDTLFINQIVATTSGGCILFGSFNGNLILGNFMLPVAETAAQSVLIRVSEAGAIEDVIPASSTVGDQNPAAICLKGDLLYAMLNGNGFVDYSYIEIYNSTTFEHLETISQNSVFTNDLDVDALSNIYLTGSCLSQDGTSDFNGTTVEGAGDYNKFLVKYNSSHEFEWIRIFDDVTCPEPSVRVSPDGNSIYFSDELYDGVMMGDIALEGPNWVYDFYIAKYNPQGELHWAKEVPNFAVGDANPGKGEFLVAENDGLAITGFFRNYLTWNQDTLLADPGSQSSLFVLKLDVLGDAQWYKGVQTQSGTTSGLSMSRAGNSYYVNGFMLGNCTFSEEYSFTGDFYQTFTAKLSETATDISKISKESELQLYPNPSSDFLQINHASTLSGKSFSIYSVSGKRLIQGVLSNSIQSVDLRSFPAGVYILSISGDVSMMARFVKM
ncbi:T9SS type A sorting domain-containing protein [Cryomorpha ignava]|uniref:T9SS type A sorting domain-containing protein n=1 Tax=Cryomorpha ignava TaxID=101383 RepID=A0A7K3WUF5_9FLAO|nr:T9SS type A sorting domain-containing protein [Cryomorpha ignava]NEN24295.1 T9SS type A sorting domain-containing protein [Cryomorpha ignava]